ncbi:malate dehydrogenase, cytoplasmic-like [Ornithodoros turicata]|uniref:malate dehydrogenase, cytoplasmic-like n=1 Tax=Ornithodoros turicata TaxID=34597 RepID=UPI00313A3E7E
METSRKEPLRVLVTSAASFIAHAILTSIAQGGVFGHDQPLILHILDSPGSMGMLEGLVLELLDCTFPLLRQVLMTTSLDSAFTDIDAGFLVYYPQDSIDTAQGLVVFRHYGYAIEKYAKKSAKFVVCSNKANAHASACVQAAPTIDDRNVTALTRLQHNQAVAQIAQKLAVAPNKVRNVIVWGSQSSTQLPDAQFATYQRRDVTVPVVDAIKDQTYLRDQFVKLIRNREETVCEGRNRPPAISRAKAACDHMRDWWKGTPEGTWVSMGVISDGSYGVPRGIVFSFPVRIGPDQRWSIVPGLQLNEYTQEKIHQSANDVLAYVRKLAGRSQSSISI